MVQSSIELSLVLNMFYLKLFIPNAHNNRSRIKQTEEEIQTLRQVLAARIKHSQDIKRKLGIGVWKELQNDLQASIKNVQETTAYVYNKLYR